VLTRASLRYYAATNALVVLGVAVAVAVLAGALLVGASVRESLKEIALGRLGNTDVVVSSPTFFRTALADDLTGKREPGTGSRIEAAPLIVAGGAVSHDESMRSAGRVMVYGVDERFGQFQRGQLTLTGREAAISQALATELGATAGDSITLRLAKPTDIPLSSVQGRRDITGERIRLTIARVLDRTSPALSGVEGLGEFSLAPSQGPVLALYVAMDRLQRDLALGDRVNTLLIAGHGIGDFLPLTLDDLGLRTRTGPADQTIVESRAGVITDTLAARIAEIASNGQPALTYVANAIRIGDREVPYSTVTAIDFGGADVRGAAAARRPESGAERDPRPLIWLNDWAARDLGAAANDVVTLDYFLWSDADGLSTHSAEFTLAGVVPMDGIGGDQTLTPEYPGISDAADITAWDPPFPVDLKKVRAAGRGLLGSLSGRAEGDRLARRRTAALGIPVRQGLLDQICRRAIH
jgi:putative ABC transport system permease protein